MSLWYIMTKLQQSFHLSERLIRCITECNDLTNSDTIEGLLNEGADVNAAHGTLLPLQCACMCSDSDAVQVLINHGAQVNNLDGYGRAAIHYAAEHDVECVEILIANNADVNILDKNEDTPLHWAVFKNKPDCARVLLENNADVNALDYNNDTPLSWAAQRSSLEPMLVLLEYNAKVDTVNFSGYTPLLRCVRMMASGLPDRNDRTCLDLLLRANGQFDLRNGNGQLPVIIMSDSHLREMLLPLCNGSRRLQQLCRFVVRQNMGVCLMPRVVPQLPIPKKIQNYLLLEY